jgi:hypothetical protein
VSAIAGVGKDIWWPLDGSEDALSERLGAILLDSGARFFESYSSYEKVVRCFLRDSGFPDQNAGRGSLAAAVIAWSLGDVPMAESLFDAALQYADAEHHAGFRSHVLELKSRLKA